MNKRRLIHFSCGAAEIARCAEHICAEGEFAGALMGWADWQIERVTGHSGCMLP